MSRTSSQFKNREEYYRITLRALAAQFCKSYSILISSLFNKELLNNAFFATENNYKRLLHRCSLVFLAFFILINLSFAQTNCGSSPDRLILSGSYDCVTIGATMSLSEDQTNCALLPSASQTLTIPTGATIKAAYLFWSASGYLDHIVKFNGKQVIAEKTFINTFQSGGFGGYDGFFGCRANVTNIVTGSGSYTLSGLSVNTEALCQGNSVYAGWAMVVVYEQTSLPTTNIHIINDAFNFTFRRKNTTTINCINVPSNCASNAKLTIVAFDGDAYKGEWLTIGGTRWPDGNTFRGQSGPNLDIVNFDVSDKIIPGTPSLTYTIEGYDVGTVWGPANEGLFDFVKILKYNTCQTPPPPALCADSTPKKTPGAACNDNNPNTMNDVIQADGCGCAGTVPPPAICQQACTPIPVVRYKAPGCGGMLPIYSGATGFSNVTAGGFVKGSATEYNCYYSNDPNNWTPSAMGVNTSVWASPFYDWGVRFTATLTPTQVGSITGLKLLQRTVAGGSISSIHPNTCSPTKYAVRVLKDGQVVHEQIDLPFVNTTGSEGPTGYYYLNIDLSQVAVLKFTQTTNFEFQLVAYDLICGLNNYHTNGKGYWHFDTVELLACNQAGFTVTATNDGPKCNQPITLTATAGATTYKWSGPNGYTATGATATATASGTYTVTATSASGCTTTSSTIVVNTAKTPGTACNDNNSNTTNDVIQADGCTCAGTTPPPICDNVLNGGTISKSCNNGIVSLTASTPVTGGTGAIEYIWLRSTTICPGDPALAIAGATGESYTIPAGSVTQTTYFARCARRVGCTVWSGSSNCITVSPNECTTPPNTCNFAPCFKSRISVLASPGWTGYTDWTLSNMPSSGWTAGAFQYSSDGGATWTSWSTTFSPASPAIGMVTYADHFQYRVTIYNSAGTCSQTLTWTFTNPPCGICGNGSARRVPGTACNDNNPNTTNDIVQPDGCSCAGTPVNGNICDFSPCLAVSDIYTQWATPDKYATWTLAQMPSSGWTNTVFQYSKDGGATWLNLSQKFSPTKLSIASLPYGHIYGEDPYIYRATFQNTAGTCTKTINWSAATPVYCGSPCDNVTFGGNISKVCNSTNGTISLNETTPASGGSGQLEYIWLRSTTICPGDPALAIPGATSANLTVNASTITQTTYFARCVRRVGCTVWTGSSNCITVSPNECAKGSIGDMTYCDNNGNGIMDAGDTPQSGVQVQLCNASNVIIATATTDAQGKYLFPNLAAGIYVAKFPTTITGGKTITTNNPITVNLGAGQNYLDADAGYKPDCMTNPVNGTITGANTICPNTTTILTASGGSSYKWNNGSTASNITVGIGTYNVTVSNTSGCSQILSKTISTTPTTITVNNCPQNITLTSSNNNCVVATWAAPSFIANCGIPSVTSNYSSGYCFPIGTTTITYTASLNGVSKICSFTVTVTAAPKGSIGDFVFKDNNCNGIQDAGDSPLSGVFVQLKNSNGATIASTISNPNGQYLFSNLVASNYQVYFTTPNGCVPALKNSIGSNADNDSNISENGTTSILNLEPGQNLTNIDAGFKNIDNASLGDRVWEDTNGNGIQDTNEIGIPNINVFLTGTDINGNIINKNTITNNVGQYLFTNLPAGTYKVSFIIPSTYIVTSKDKGTNDLFDSDIESGTNMTGSYTLTSGQSNLSVDAGLYRPACIGNFVFVDTDRDGIQDVGEIGYTNIAVTLSGLTNAGMIVNLTTLTDLNGNYKFNNLTPGKYQIQIITPNGFALTIANQGSDEAKDSDIDPSTGKSTEVSVSSGQSYLLLDVGIFNKFNTPCSGDLTTPTFSNVPNSVTIECGQSYSLPTPLVSDNCSPYSSITLSTTTNTETVGKCPVKKIITRTWKATDQNGNTATVSRSVTFIDTQAPVISGIPADVTIQCGQNIPVPPPYGANGIQAFDNCDGLLTNKITFSEIYFGGGCQSNATSNGKSKIICTWTVKDACGNAAVKSWAITILPISASRESSNTDKKPTLKDSFEDPTIERSIIDSSKDNVLVYPNPSNGYFSIEAGKSKIEKITVLDIHGKALRQVENYEDLSTLNLDLSNENNGVYLLLIQVNNGLITKKISIKR